MFREDEILYCVIFTMYGCYGDLHVRYFCQPILRGGSIKPHFLQPRPLFDDHFQLESGIVLVHCTLDEIHVPMLIVHVQNCTRLYCLDLAYQYWPSGVGCDQTALHVICIWGCLCLVHTMDYMSILCLNTEVHVLINLYLHNIGLSTVK